MATREEILAVGGTVPERYNETSSGYTYKGTDYKYETRYDANNQPYQVALPGGTTTNRNDPFLVNAPTASNNYTTTVPQPSTSGNSYSFIGSSDQTRSSENSLTSQIRNLLANPSSNTGLTDAYKAVIDNYNSYNDALEKRRQQQMESINRQFDITKTQTQDAQKKEFGATNAGLIRAGGYLGDSGSAQGVINNLGEKQRLEIATLEAKRQDAINAAQNAIDDKQFALASEKASTIKSLEKEINDRKNTFFNQILNLTQEDRAQQTADRQKIDDQLKAMALVDPSTISTAQTDYIDNFYKTPGFTKSYLAASSAAAKAKTQKDQLDASKAYIELLSSVPAGMSIGLPDGSKVSGIGKAGDYEVFNKEDANGRVTVVRFNKATGTFTEYNAGNIGTPSASNSEEVSITKLKNFTDTFSSLEKDDNGFLKGITSNGIDPVTGMATSTVKISPVGVYNALRQGFIKGNPDIKKAGEVFDNNYLKYLNGSDRASFTKDGY